MRAVLRAQLRVIVKRILRKYSYPPDKQEKATRTVLEQAEVLSGMWASAHLLSFILREEWSKESLTLVYQCLAP